MKEIKSKCRRLLPLLLVLVMVFQEFPVAAFADENIGGNESEVNAVAGTAFNMPSDEASAEGEILDTDSRTVPLEPTGGEQGEAEGSGEETVEAENTEAVDSVVIEAAETNNIMARGLMRSSGDDRTGDFKMDKCTVRISGYVINADETTSKYDEVVYEYGATSAQTNLAMYTNPNVTVALSWSQADLNQADFVAGEYIQFEICKVSGCDLTDWSSFTEISLLFEGVQLGTGKLVVEETGTDETTLYFKVTFTENVVGKHGITGSMSAGADITGLKQGDEIVFSSSHDVDSSVFADITIVAKPSSGIGTMPGANGQPLYLNKSALNYSASANTIRWRIYIHSPGLITAGFEAYANGAYTTGGQIGNYSDIIIEETLDEHQSFYNSNGDLDIEFRMPFWLYDSKYTTDGSFYSYGNLSTKNLLTLLTKITEATNAETEAKVKKTARSYAVITEQDPDDPSVMRERLIMNLGAFGSTGLRYGELMTPGGAGTYGSFIYWINKLVECQEICEAAIAGAPNGASANTEISYYSPSQKLTYTYTKEKWELLERLYREAYDYYSITDESGNLIGPYVSGFELDVVTRVLTGNIETLLTATVANSVSATGVLLEYEKDATQKNSWSADISARVATNGDIQIFKADSLYGNEAGNKTDAGAITGAMGRVSFQVYESGEPNPLTFNLSNEGKYVYDSSGSGSYTEVTTYSSNGSVILSGLNVGTTYYLKEYDAPDGYYTGQNQEIAFSVDGNSIVFKLLNNDARGVTLTKVDADDRTPLADATFKLYKYNDTTEDYDEITGFKATEINKAEYLVYNETGTDPLTTGSDGKLSIVQLPAGKYYLIEVLAPSGYQRSDTKHEFVLSESLEAGGAAIVDLEEIENELISTSVTLEGTKDLASKDLTDDMFHFTVTDENDDIVSTGTNKADGSITFSDIILTSAGTYTYTVSEVNDGAGGIIYDETEYTVTVEVEDNGDGSLSATVDYPASGLIFNNEYTTDSIPVTLEGTKYLASKDLTDDMFRFAVTDEKDDIVSTGTNKADGSITFSDIILTSAGTYTYTVSEVNDGAGGITYDETKYTVTVEVEDNGDGSLSAMVDYPASGLAFNNEYTTDSVLVNLKGTKYLTGKELTDNMFSFAVTDENGDIVSTGTNKADGSITFSDLTLSSTGTYTYTVSEVNGGAGGITYDETEYAVKVEVEDNGDGSLSAIVNYPESGLVFNNKYTTGDPPVAFTGTKNFTGKELTDDMFSFIVKDKDGKIVSTGTNKADGTIAFSEIGFHNPGVYTFTVSEVKGNAEGITYDETEYTGVVTVVDNGDGTLTAEASYPDGKIQFNNSYSSGSNVSGSRKTGDESMLYGWFIVLFIAVSMTGILFGNSKKKACKVI